MKKTQTLERWQSDFLSHLANLDSEEDKKNNEGFEVGGPIRLALLGPQIPRLFTDLGGCLRSRASHLGFLVEILMI